MRVCRTARLRLGLHGSGSGGRTGWWWRRAWTSRTSWPGRASSPGAGCRVCARGPEPEPVRKPCGTRNGFGFVWNPQTDAASVGSGLQWLTRPYKAVPRRCIRAHAGCVLPSETPGILSWMPGAYRGCQRRLPRMPGAYRGCQAPIMAASAEIRATAAAGPHSSIRSPAYDMLACFPYPRLPAYRPLSLYTVPILSHRRCPCGRPPETSTAPWAALSAARMAAAGASTAPLPLRPCPVVPALSPLPCEGSPQARHLHLAPALPCPSLIPLTLYPA